MFVQRAVAGLILLAASLLAACGLTVPAATEEPTAAPTEAPAEEGRPLVLGDISDDPSEVIEGAQPLADYLAARLADQGVSEGQVRVTSTTEEMIELLKSGEVDLYFDSVYPAALISDASGAQPVLRRWRNGVAEYYSVIFTVEGTGIASVGDLAGRMVAMDNQYSTSGFTLPAVYLTEQGLTLSIKESPDDLVKPDEVGVVFAYDDENILQWVIDGRVDAGVTDDYHFGVFGESAEGLVELATTESVPRQVLLVRPGLEPELLEAIKAALLAADEDEEGQAALEAFDETAQFDEFPEGIDAALARMDEMKAIINTIIEAED